MNKALGILFICLLLISETTIAQQATRRILTQEDAKNLIAAAEERAAQDEWNVVIVIVDAGGHLLGLTRMDNVQLSSIEIAIQKAKAAAFYRRPTKVFQDRHAGGETGVLALPGVMPFEGGVPIEYDGRIIGAIGVSGVTAAQDGMIANAALESFNR
ncbi:MAG: heme-binding protein [Balneolales bacterium]